jgi:cytochrome c oxidase cbb3-type subunit 2
LLEKRWLVAAFSIPIAVFAAGWQSGVVAQLPDTSVTSAPAPQAAGSAERGRTIYQKYCVECHGASGKGDGPASHLLVPRPRDFTLGRYKIRSTETGSVPTDDDLIQSVKKGLYGSAMPGWETILADADITDVVAHLKSLSPRFTSGAPQAVVATARVVSSKESVGRGAAVYERLQCGKCHGSDGRGTGAAATSFTDDWGYPLGATDLTEPWTFHGGATAADVFMRFRVGMSGTPMPSFKDAASEPEMWDLANWVVSIARKPLWEMNAEQVARFYEAEDARARADPVRRGQYLVRTLGCVYCHSPVDQERRLIPGLLMAGGLRIGVEPFGVYFSGNLTSDTETGLGTWSDDEIKRVITQGILKDGTRLLPYPMDWSSFASMSGDDLNAIVAYLRTIPPVSNKVPPPARPFLPRYLWGKFRMLLLGYDPPMIFYAGNAGTASGSAPKAAR